MGWSVKSKKPSFEQFGEFLELIFHLAPNELTYRCRGEVFGSVSSDQRRAGVAQLLYLADKENTRHSVQMSTC